MRVNELEKLTLNQLKAGADSCFHDASVNDRDLVNVEHLLKAQVYLSEIAHRYDAKIARRDLILEIVVIVLIAAEIGIAWMEGRSQSRALDAMAGSANQSVIAMKSVSDSLGKLNDKQDRSLEAQRTANKNLQDSLNQTTLMATALRRQLKIIESEQADRLTQAAKKPKLQITVNGIPLSIPNSPIAVRDQTETSQTYDFVVTNVGDATAHNGILRIATNATGVQMSVSGANSIIPVTEPKDTVGAEYTAPFLYLRAGTHFTLPITFSYPKGSPPFIIIFNVDVDELNSQTPLGFLTIFPSSRLNASPRP
jgi:hypothetical protein